MRRAIGRCLLWFIDVARPPLRPNTPEEGALLKELEESTAKVEAMLQEELRRPSQPPPRPHPSVSFRW
jgi:hypothetical protein